MQLRARRAMIRKLSFYLKFQPVSWSDRGHFPSIRPSLYQQRNNKDRKWSGSERARKGEPMNCEGAPAGGAGRGP